MSCGGCGQEITVGKILTALEKKWHPDCFKCDDCDGPITGGSFSIKNDMPICTKCANQGRDQGDDEDGPLGKDCGKCGKPLTGVAVQGLTGGFWHPECFTCFDCGDVIDGSKGFIKDKDGQPLHGQCAKNRGMGGAAAGESCGKCGKELLGSCVTAMDRSYHKECFSCSSCSGSISGGFLVVNDQPYCKKCHTAGKTSPSPPIVTSGTTVIEIPAEKKTWSKKKDDGMTSKIARNATKQANKTTGYYGGGYEDESSKPTPKPKSKPTPKVEKASGGGDIPPFCGECGNKSTGGRFCGECGFKFF